MRKKDLSIIIESAKTYSKSLENKNVLIIFLNRNNQKLEHFELLFENTNFLHLTGVDYKRSTSKAKNAKEFYSKCLNGKLNINYIKYRLDGTTRLKLEVLPQIIKLHKTASMVGDFNNFNIKLETEKIYGTITACLGAVQDKNGYYRPNTALKTDVRDVTEISNPIKAIYVKNKYDLKYTTLTKKSKDFKFDDLPNDIKLLLLLKK